MPTDYSKYNFPPMPLTQGDIVQDYLEFSGEDEGEVFNKIMDFHSLTKPEFHELKDNFYAESNTYIYDILSGNPSRVERANVLNKFIPGILQFIKDHPGTKFADFGGGTGTTCSIIEEWTDKEVSYIDLESKMTDFARFRFKKHNQNVNIVVIPEDSFELPEKYDVILTDAVWEHLPPQKQLDYAVKLTNYINENGLFVLIIDLSGVNPEMPMHFDVDIVQLHNTIETNGMNCLFGRNSFASVWHRPTP